MKTLDQVEPRIPVNSVTAPGTGIATFRISQAGSYYLTGNVSGQPGRHGILIDAGDVTLDLMGFTLVGSVGSLHGVGMTSPRDNVTVRNGQVRGWGGAGVSLQSDSGRIESITAVSCIGAGIMNSAASFMTVIRSCEVRDSGGAGIAAGANAVISGCNVRIALGAGIAAAETAVVEGCTVQDATLEGIQTGRNARVNGCAVRVAGGAGGVVVGPGSTVGGTTVTDCLGPGLAAGPGSAIDACVSRDNGGAGFALDDAATLRGSTSAGNGGGGVTLAEGGVVSGCTISANAGDGVNAASACTIMGCTVLRNSGDEIQVDRDCVVIDNTCKGISATPGTGAGVRVTGPNNRVEDNNLSDNDRGADVTGMNNIVVRNTASGNVANFQIAGGNSFGPVVIVAGVGDIAGVANANHPGANYSY
jgi:parallel beta-helix repeat protein